MSNSTPNPVVEYTSPHGRAPIIRHNFFQPGSGFSEETHHSGGILLLRHTHTLASSEGKKVFLGNNKDNPLAQISTEGRLLASRCALVLSDSGFIPDLYLSNNAGRCVDTAGIISEDFNYNGQIIVLNMYGERHLGALEGMQRSDLSHEGHFLLNHPLDSDFRNTIGAESTMEFFARAAVYITFLKKVYEMSEAVLRNPKIIIITSGGILDSMDLALRIYFHSNPNQMFSQSLPKDLSELDLPYCKYSEGLKKPIAALKIAPCEGIFYSTDLLKIINLKKFREATGLVMRQSSFAALKGVIEHNLELQRNRDFSDSANSDSSS